MGAVFLQAASFHRLDPPGHERGITCDEQGPALGPIRLLVKQTNGFAPRPVDELNRILGRTFGRVLDCSDLALRLETVARALNDGHLARAAFATLYLHLPALIEDEARRAAEAAGLLKASPDDYEHPGWPAGTEGGRGGQFRPKDGEANDGKARLSRLIRRREIRIALRHILARRLGRLVVEAAGLPLARRRRPMSRSWPTNS